MKEGVRVWPSILYNHPNYCVGGFRPCMRSSVPFSCAGLLQCKNYSVYLFRHHTIIIRSESLESSSSQDTGGACAKGLKPALLVVDNMITLLRKRLVQQIHP